ncbi:regulatory protein [Actinoplanes sp. SE50]|uniref:helix-turn-helix domain-containing protein n=1 Tax=unclassified Actinoplanes TaxID=2626549 RepID=UPI00023EC8DC|nr:MULTISPECIES: helix-turn-helix transcriptional regulator [unclassified Actinoplanes]AEV82007.1 regulatory protein [Actinoplanes sp. SE50/110]ATO80406.1 regulatory protein [Actinoplanes sp. SE50]SLL97813.1 transcriptional regulator [Actinoplanes sp. SE50/110]
MTAAFGGRLRELRKARGFSQRELAAPRYTAAFVSSVESGRRAPSTDAVAYFAERLGVTPRALTTGEDPDHRVRARLALADADAQDGAADAAYRKLASEGIFEPQCRLGLGRLALRRGEIADAAREFAAAARLLAGEPAHVRAHAVAGQAACLRAQGDPRYAAHLLHRVLTEMDLAALPDPAALVAIHAQLALCHADLEDETAAAASASAALSLAGPREAGSLADLHLTVARTLLSTNDLAGADLALHRAGQARQQATLAPELAACRLIRGRARRTAGDLPGALRDLSPVDGPVSAEAAVELAAVYADLGLRDQAHDLLPERLPAADRLRARLAEEVGDHEAAEHHLRVAADGYRTRGPRRELATTILALADLLDRRNRPEDALTALRDGLTDVLGPGIGKA